MTLLVGDIGGTNGRFGLVSGEDLRPDAVASLANADHDSFEDEVAAYLDGLDDRPDHAVFALAGPVAGRSMRLTNLDWTIDADAIARRFGLARVTLVNDFAAQAAALPHYRADELFPIGAAQASAEGAKVALGPGTGLGVAGLLRTGTGWTPVPSEGGHIELAAVDEREAAVLAVLRRDFGRVSAERALSGPGIARLHAALTEIDGRGDVLDEASDVAARAQDGDALAIEAIETFLRLFARFAGDMALTFGAQGGAYICGGVVPKLRHLIDDAAFRTAFEAKRPHEGLMRRTATLVVLSEISGLLGCAALAASAGASKRDAVPA
ncbi:glucokinase [Methylopila turkensis]|uniref:Glucokinase n=1 Tax=Methylopila turkensis TaxID=1437816 RepID=A0A9W6JRG2_9HYPH|nr:glucokinase [Methylopila turkensis]GLK81902.1 glucokinase [Methylopila turkensis]